MTSVVRRSIFVQLSWMPSIVVAATVSVISLLIFSEFLQFVSASWIIFGILALSLTFLWGEAGIISFGQTSLFGLSGYVYGILSINFAQANGDTVSWALISGIAVGGVVAGLLGAFLFYGRVGPIQTSIATYAFTLILWRAATGLNIRVGKAVLGGDNGMTGIPGLRLALYGGARDLAFSEAFLIYVVFALGVYLLLKFMQGRPLGLIINAVRSNPLRAELLGYDVRFYRFISFVIGGTIAGVAGSLFASWSNYMNPFVFSPQQALLVPIYVLVGGLRRFGGAFVGAFAVGALAYWLGGGAGGGQTTLVLGVILIGVVLFFREGILGFLGRFSGSLRLTRVPLQEVVPPSGFGVRENPGGPELEGYTAVGHAHTQPRERVLQTIELKKQFGGLTAVDGVSIDFRDREIRCIIGPNGAGKSTYLSMLVGLVRPTSGRILLKGRDVTREEAHRRIRVGIGLKPQIPQIFGDLTVYENLWLAAFSKSPDSRSAISRVEEVLQVIKLDEKAGLPAAHLSHGEQQWLDIGLVLSLDPLIILLDEPTAGMTREERRLTAELVKRMASIASVVVVEHDMDFVRSLASPTIVLHQGRIMTAGTIEEIRRDPRVLDVYLGRRAEYAAENPH